MSVAVYVQKAYAKKAYKEESYNIRQWMGVEMLRDELTREGVQVEYCSAETVTDHEIILVSIISAIDWYSFIQERVTWDRGNYTVIIGGAGVDNVRPFLEYGDIFFFGRADGFVVQLINETLAGNKLDEPFVCYSEDFSMDKSYMIRQVDRCYPHAFNRADDREFKEIIIGCKRRCFFCAYSWQRRYVNPGFDRDGDYNDYAGTVERTIFELDLEKPETWLPDGGQLIIGIDGSSERIRFMVNKPITDRMIELLFVGLPRTNKLYRIKAFNVVGYPTETAEDRRQLIDLIERVDRDMDPGDRIYRIDLFTTPFKPMPCTPSATWPMMYQDFRLTLARELKKELTEYKNKLFEGNVLSVSLNWGIEALPTLVLWALAMRGTEKDGRILQQIALSKKFWRSSKKDQKVTLEKHLDIERLFGSYTWQDLPTRYLKTYVTNEGLERAGNLRMSKYGGS